MFVLGYLPQGPIDVITEVAQGRIPSDLTGSLKLSGDEHQSAVILGSAEYIVPVLTAHLCHSMEEEAKDIL